MVARPRCIGLTWLPCQGAWVWQPCQTHALGSSNHTSPCMGMANMFDLKNNKQRGQLCTLIVSKGKKEKCKQSIIDSNPINHLSTRATPWERGHGCASS